MSFDLLQIWQSMDLFARLVVVSLAIMAMLSTSVFFERVWYFRKNRRVAGQFLSAAADALEHARLEGIVAAAENFRGSPLPDLLAAGAKAFTGAAHNKRSGLAPIEVARRELVRRTEASAADIRRGFGVLASVGSVAPFVGLLGTVVGIIAAFEGIAKEGSGGIGAVSAGIAEALVVTAFGLVVAIPAVLAFNYLSSRADQLTLALERARGEFLDHLEVSAPTIIPLSHSEDRARAASTPAGVEFSAVS
jgi:biopolymer transport protein ExbB